MGYVLLLRPSVVCLQNRVRILGKMFVDYILPKRRRIVKPGHHSNRDCVLPNSLVVVRGFGADSAVLKHLLVARLIVPRVFV